VCSSGPAAKKPEAHQVGCRCSHVPGLASVSCGVCSMNAGDEAEVVGSRGRDGISTGVRVSREEFVAQSVEYGSPGGVRVRVRGARSAWRGCCAAQVL
jgi:hypothetical protein